MLRHTTKRSTAMHEQAGHLRCAVFASSRQRRHAKTHQPQEGQWPPWCLAFGKSALSQCELNTIARALFRYGIGTAPHAVASNSSGAILMRRCPTHQNGTCGEDVSCCSSPCGRDEEKRTGCREWLPHAFFHSRASTRLARRTALLLRTGQKPWCVLNET